MDELKELGHRSGCWYKHIKEEDNAAKGKKK
jgi:hypothetical protein